MTDQVVFWVSVAGQTDYHFSRTEKLLLGVYGFEKRTDGGRYFYIFKSSSEKVATEQAQKAAQLLLNNNHPNLVRELITVHRQGFCSSCGRLTRFEEVFCCKCGSMAIAPKEIFWSLPDLETELRK